MTPKRNIADLSLERLREVLAYDPLTGHLTWRVRLGPMCKFGKSAGVLKSGYRRIAIDRRSYTASHLAWFHYYGVRPLALLDHKNGDPDDNRMENLREATHCQNSQNVGVRSNNSAGLKGASQFNRKYSRAKYRSSITINKKRIFLGLFHTAEAAHAAYCKAAAEMHGEFANLGESLPTPPIHANHGAGR
jgi:hypothetical protein